MKKFAILHTPSNTEIAINVDNIVAFNLMTELTNVSLSSGKSEAVKESPDEIIRLIDSLDSELPTGEFTGGELIDETDDDELPTGEFTGGELIPDDDELPTGEFTLEETDYRKECNAMPGTSFEFGELEISESGFPLLQLLYTNKKGEQKESWIGPFRKYDFSVGPKSDIGCGQSSPQMFFEVLKTLNSDVRSAVISAFASAAISNWCAAYEIIPNHQTRITWSENKWRDFIKACHKYIFGEESPLL